MAQIFISWSSADANFVNRLAQRLTQEGFSVDEYSTDPTGGNIGQNVHRYVANAAIALVCLSERSVDKPWINDEVAWCAYRYFAERSPEMIPILIGNVPEGSIPNQLRGEPWRRRFPVPAEPSDSDIAKLLETVRAMLGKEAKRVMPAALLAMTRTEAEQWIEDPATRRLLEPLCKAVGMNWDINSKTRLLSRYGDTAEDFAPFPGKKIKDIVGESLQIANLERKSGKREQLGIWWCTAELLDTDNVDNKRATQLWEKGSSLALVDSVSVLKKKIYDEFTNLPEPNNAAASAMLWIPPYTLHTSELEKITEETLKTLNRLLQKFNRWGTDNSRPYLAFDVGTGPTLRRWLHEALCYADNGLQPDDDAVKSMEGLASGNFHPSTFFYTS